MAAEGTGQDATGQAAEPTMEEILASIRKIIATEAPPENQAAETDIIELTDVVEDQPPAPEPEPPAPPVEEPPPEPPVQAPPPEPAPAPEPRREEAVASPTAPVQTTDQTLISPDAVALSANSFASLAEQLQKQRITLPAHIEFADGKQTVENLIAELMRPLLKEWLDQNLPATVERLVQKEIERINRRHGD